MEESHSSKGILSSIELSIGYIRIILNSIEELARSKDPFTKKSLEKIKKIIIGIKNMDSELHGVPVSLDRTYEIVKDIINHVHESRSQLKGAVNGLIKQTGEQITKVTSATEAATTKILDVSDALTEKQNDLIDKFDELVKQNPELEATIEGFKEDVYSQQDDTFMILDHLQFQDITSQQLEGAFSMLNSIEERLLLVAKLLEGLDDLTFETLQKRNTAFDKDAEFKDQTETQGKIDELFSSNIGNESKEEISEVVELPVEEVAVQAVSTEAQVVEAVEEEKKPSSGGAISQADIDKMMQQAAAPVKKEEKKPSSGGAISQADIDKMMQQAAAPAKKKEKKPSSGGAVSQADIDKMMQQAAAPVKKEEKKPSSGGAVSQADIDKMMQQAAVPVKKEEKKPSSGGAVSQADIDKMMQQAAAPVKKEEKKPSSGGAVSQADIDKMMQQAAAPAKKEEKKPSSGGAVSQADIDKMMQQAAAPAKKEEKKPSSGGAVSQADIDKMMQQAAAPVKKEEKKNSTKAASQSEIDELLKSLG